MVSGYALVVSVLIIIPVVMLIQRRSFYFLVAGTYVVDLFIV